MRLILDLGTDERSSLFVAGSGRSGTTWIGEALASAAGARGIFEPLVLDDALAVATFRREYRNDRSLGNNRQLYLAPDMVQNASYDASLEAILGGDVAGKWCDRGTRPGVYRRRVIKEIRANLSLAYIARRWPQLKIIWVVRDPISVVRSQLTMARDFGWTFDFAIDDIVFHDRLMDDWLAPYAPLLRSATSHVQRLAHRWCIETMVPLWQGVHGLGNVMLVRYEDLISDIETWHALMRFPDWRRPRSVKLGRILSRLSSTCPSAMAGSRTDYLTSADVTAIERVVERYGAEDWLCSTRSHKIESMSPPWFQAA